MTLYTKQDFCPTIFTRRWLAMKFRPNMLIYSRNHVIAVLESGLLFREDSVEVEQEAAAAGEAWLAARGGRSLGFTRGEAVAGIAAAASCIAAFPPRSFNRSSLLNLAAYIFFPIVIRVTHRSLARGSLASLLSSMREYLALARRAAACLKEYAALHNQLGSISSCIESTHAMLCRQQSELCNSMSRACSTLLGNAPWLRGDVAWDALEHESDNLMKIHHAFLVIQSTLLKHIAMVHFVPSAHAQRIYRNQNERIYWLHNVLIAHLNNEFKQNYETLERMYRLLRNFGSNDNLAVKKLGPAMLDSWVYSEIHNGVARTNLELKFASNKCNALDVFLDSCCLHKQELDLVVLERDLEEIIDDITKCLNTVQNSQIRLKKMKNKMVGGEKEVVIEQKVVTDDENLIKIDDRMPEVKDEVFYLMRTDDDGVLTPADDVMTAPGKREKETTRIVLKELKRKLGKREDVMRERERQALAKTMPELKGRIPEFERQIKFDDFVIKKGFLSKTKRDKKPNRLFVNYKIKRNDKIKKYKLKFKVYNNVDEIPRPFYEANETIKFKSEIITVDSDKVAQITKWRKSNVETVERIKTDVFSDNSEGLSDVESNTANKAIHQAINNLLEAGTSKSNRPIINGDNNRVNEAINDVNGNESFKFTKKDLELSSSSDSDEFYKEKQLAILKDMRKHRAARRKNHLGKRFSVEPVVDKEDECLKPMEYSLGTGLAMASVLQINSNAKMPVLVQEEVFIGDGEVSNDSGNDEYA